MEIATEASQMTTNNNETARDWIIKIAFGTMSPPLGTFPHCIFKDSDSMIQIVAKLSEDPIGVWGDRPWYNGTGGPYLPPSKYDPVEEFRVWRLARNQECALNYSKYRNTAEFKMIIPANLPPEVLRRPLEAFDAEDGCFRYAKYINRLADWIGDLRWAYVPLESSETESAMLVAPHSNAGFVDRVEQALRKGSIEVARLIRRGERFYLTDV